ncbi:lipid II:glycine glycyltransferase FemX [Methanococcoides methylutens]|uniref:BioF2-like acetyltransferase domain-containing protein n=1 Tax=Methanococcoides methylutens MM1 TaxID=1434104 RepID=A0A0E3SP09_METMT|nr:GNAT family N-acetyltransferase [Methanococcoides methylutens]AKB84291.1 hypothetical protein MCMEM_0238 [Methanococcoides methylutens MM1]
MHITSEITDQKWDEYVKSHPFGNIFQTTSMFNVYRNTKGYFPIKVCAVNEVTNEIDGVLLGVTIHEMTGLLGKGFLGKFSTRSIIQGGPLVSDNSIVTLSKMILEYDQKVQNNSLYNQIWNLNDNKKLLQNMKYYKYEGHLNFLIKLDQPEETLWLKIHKSKRKNINRMLKKGVIIEEIKNKKKIPVFYELLKETYSRVKVPLADITLFASAFDQLVPKNMARFFLAKYDDAYIGGRAILTYNDLIYDWYAAASNNALSMHPNECLVWHILKWGMDNNYKLFDFGGAGKPGMQYGPREFKREFGGDMVNYGRYTHIYSPLKMKFTDIGLKLYQKSPL